MGTTTGISSSSKKTEATEHSKLNAALKQQMQEEAILCGQRGIEQLHQAPPQSEG